MLDPKQVGDLLESIKAFAYYDDRGRPIGVDGRIRINYFLDILSACHDDDMCGRLGELFSKMLPVVADMKDVDCLIVPKRGNVLLAKQVAKLLGLRSAAVRESILFNRWMEGPVGAGSRALLIDDIASDGEVLCDAADNARKAGVFVQQVVVLIDRQEGDAAHMFALEGIPFSCLCQLGDADIQNIFRTRAS